MQFFRQGLGQTIGEGLDHNRVVVVVRCGQLRDEQVEAFPSGDRECSDPVLQTRLHWCHEVGE